jgi:hypothetical protein
LRKLSEQPPLRRAREYLPGLKRQGLTLRFAQVPREVLERGGARYLPRQRARIELDEMLRRLHEIAHAQPLLQELRMPNRRIVGLEPGRTPIQASMDQRLARKDQPRLLGRDGPVVHDAVRAQGEPQESSAFAGDDLFASLIPIGLEILAFQ